MILSQPISLSFLAYILDIIIPIGIIFTDCIMDIIDMMDTWICQECATHTLPILLTKALETDPAMIFSLWQALSHRALNKEKGYDDTLHHPLNDVGRS